MNIEGINIKETENGMIIVLEGDLYKKIAQEWEIGNIKPFYSHLKLFIKNIQIDYSI